MQPRRRAFDDELTGGGHVVALRTLWAVHRAAPRGPVPGRPSPSGSGARGFSAETGTRPGIDRSGRRCGSPEGCRAGSLQHVRVGRRHVHAFDGRHRQSNQDGLLLDGLPGKAARVCSARSAATRAAPSAAGPMIVELFVTLLRTVADLPDALQKASLLAMAEIFEGSADEEEAERRLQVFARELRQKIGGRAP